MAAAAHQAPMAMANRLLRCCRLWPPSLRLTRHRGTCMEQTLSDLAPHAASSSARRCAYRCLHLELPSPLLAISAHEHAVSDSRPRAHDRVDMPQALNSNAPLHTTLQPRFLCFGPCRTVRVHFSVQPLCLVFSSSNREWASSNHSAARIKHIPSSIFLLKSKCESIGTAGTSGDAKYADQRAQTSTDAGGRDRKPATLRFDAGLA
jgi:hypothetical protein